MQSILTISSMPPNILLFQLEKSSLYNGAVYAMRKFKCYGQVKKPRRSARANGLTTHSDRN